MKDRGQFSTSANGKLSSHASALQYTEKFARNTHSSFKAKNTTTEMNKSAPQKFNQSVHQTKNIPDYKGLTAFYKQRAPSASKRISLSNTGTNE
jgi:hypothetical protein